MTDEQRHSATREDIAAVEVGHTDVGQGVKLFLTAGFIAIMLVVPLVEQFSEDWMVARVADVPPPGEAIASAFRERGMLGGIRQVNADTLRRIRLFEDSLEDESVISEALIPPMQSLLVGILRAGNENAYCGRDGWLFYRPGIDYLTGRGFLDERVLKARSRQGDEYTAPPQPDPVAAIVEFRDQLAAQGIELVVMPAPVKAAIYPERFSRRYEGRERLQNPSYGLFTERLDEAGVRLLNVAPALMAVKDASDAPLYLATDTHWTPEGLDVATKALADLLRNDNLVSEPGGIRYETSTQTIENLGDVAVMLNLPEKQTVYKPETVAIQEVTNWEADPNAEILLLGDSFANIYSQGGMGWGEGAGLAEQLSAALQRPVDAIRINDAGAYATREQLSRELARGRNRLAGKKVVVWEFAMRELAVGDWKLGLDLVLGEETTQAPATDTPLRVRGTLAKLTQPPRPGSTPYPESIVALHLKDLDVESGALDESEIVVLMWGMLNREWTDAARYQVGQDLTFELVPWSEVEADYGTYNRNEFFEPELFLLDIYWAVEPDFGSPGEDESTVDSTPSPAPSDGTPIATPIDTDDRAEAFRQALANKVAALEAAGANTYRGEFGWLFFGPELRHLSVGPFWGDRAREVSRATDLEFADPLEAILDFKRQLDTAGIELMLLPVPPKAIVYPDFVAPEVVTTAVRLDTALQEFYARLREEGVDVLDLTDNFMDVPVDESTMFCLQDTHWSGEACRVAARAIAKRVAGRPWLQAMDRIETVTTTREVEITGDLWKNLGDETEAKETLPLSFVTRESNGRQTPVDADRDSPVLLLGDSHTLVFSIGGDLHARGAGLPDHLAHELGIAVDLVGVRGSGATPARINLARRGDNLRGKKLVIWCFSAREFTEAPAGWRKIPVIR